MRAKDRASKIMDNTVPAVPAEAPAKNESNPKKEKSSSDSLVRKALGLMNKVTPNTFKKILEQLSQMHIPDEQTLHGVVERAIFESVLLEPNFAGLFAQLCAVLTRTPAWTITEEKQKRAEGAEDNGSAADKKENCITLRRAVLNRLQKIFESFMNSKEELQKEMGALDESERADEESNCRRRVISCVRFTSELYMEGLLKHETLMYCIKSLSFDKEDPHPESVEIVQTLLWTCGKKLEAADRPFVGKALERASFFSNHKKLPARIRFLLKDLLELKANNWVPKRQEKRQERRPKTLSEVHSDYLEEVRRQKGEDVKAACRAVRKISLKSNAVLPPVMSTTSRDGVRDTLIEGRPGSHRKPGGNRQGMGVRPPAPPLHAEYEDLKLNFSNVPEEKQARRVQSMIDEFITSQDYFELEQCGREVLEGAGSIDRVPNTARLLIEKVFENVTLEGQPCDEKLVSALLVHLAKKGILKISAIDQGLLNIVPTLPGFTMDNSNAMDTVSKIIASLLAELCYPLKNFWRTVFAHSLQEDFKVKFLATTLRSLKEKCITKMKDEAVGINLARDILVRGGGRPNELFRSHLAEVEAEYGLRSIIKVPRPPDYSKTIKTALAESSESVNTLKKKIEEVCSKEHLEAPAVSAITVGALFEISSDGDGVSNASLISYFKKYIELLSYLGKDAVQQMVIMFETNRLLVERQVKNRDVIIAVMELLKKYVVGKEAFDMWKQVTPPAHVPMCLSSS